MPSLGGWEWIIIAGVFLAIPIAVIVLIVVLVRNSRRRAVAAPAPSGYLPASAPQAALPEQQLAEADRLLAGGHISQAEHASMRGRILGLPPTGPQ